MSDMRTEGVDQRAAKGAEARGTKKNGKEDAAVVTLDPLKKKLRDLGKLAVRVATAQEELKDACKAVAEASGLNVSTVKRMVKAQSGDFSAYDDEKRKVEQLGLVFAEIGYQGKVTELADGPKTKQ